MGTISSASHLFTELDLLLLTNPVTSCAVKSSHCLLRRSGYTMMRVREKLLYNKELVERCLVLGWHLCWTWRCPCSEFKHTKLYPVFVKRQSAETATTQKMTVQHERSFYFSVYVSFLFCLKYICMRYVGLAWERFSKSCFEFICYNTYNYRSQFLWLWLHQLYICQNNSCNNKAIH